MKTHLFLPPVVPALLAFALALAPFSSAVAADALIDQKPTAPNPIDASDAALAPGKVVTPDNPTVRREDTDRTPRKSDPKVSHPPLRLQFDSRPINRDAPDRVSYAPIVKKTAGSVVFVYSTKKIKAPDLSPFLNDPMFRRFFDIPGHGNLPGAGGDDGAPGGGGSRGFGGSGHGADRGGRSHRMPDRVEQGLGSGIVISDDGYILTNNHVVDDADEVQVSIGESTKKLDAKIIGRDSLADIAVLKVETAKKLVPAVFGDSDQLQVGDVVLAIGDPFGIGQSVSRGIVSALGRGQLGIEQLEDFIQTDAAINPGNSGGALIDSEGRVVGINTAILSSSGGFNGVGLAIPINLVRFVAEQIVNKGHVDRGFLGVSTQDLSGDIAEQFHAENGALINEVTPDSPAEKAGLKAGDVITKVNGTAIRDQQHLQLVITQLAPDTPVTVEYLRDGKAHTVKATLGLRPNRLASGEAAGPDTGKDEGVLNGVGVGEITPQLRDELQIPNRIKGAIITSIDPNSASAQQGLREGDVILELDRKPVHNAGEAVKLSEEIKGPKVMVLIWRSGGTRFVVIDESEK